MEEEKEEKSNPMKKVAAFIVDKRNGFFLIYIIACIACIFSSQWVSINNDITSYLPAESETRIGITLMDDEFVTYGTARIMVSNITYVSADKLAEEIRGIDGVSQVEFDDTTDHFTSASALFSVTFKGESDDDSSIKAMSGIKELLAPYDTCMSSDVGDDSAASLDQEMNVVLAIAACIILSVLLFTSKTWLEVPVLLLTFGAAALLNKGTNYWMDSVSFVTNSIAIVLQLALAIDYAIILCHRYLEEREIGFAAREAVINALSKAIPEISSSSLTTVSGLVALMLMQFRLGFDMGIVLVKAILFSLLAVFTLMPGLLMLFSKGIDKTHHKNFVPSISKWGNVVWKTRKIVPPIFLLVVIAAFFFSSNCSFCYGNNTVDPYKLSDSRKAEIKIDKLFGSVNNLAVMVPGNDYDKQKQLVEALENVDGIDTITALCNVEVSDDYTLTDKLTPRQFSELADIDVDVSRLLYSAYAVDQEQYGKLVSGVDNYSVPVLDMFMFLYDEKEAGYVTLDDELNDKVNDLYVQLSDAKAQLLGENYSRILLKLSLPEEGEATFACLDEIHAVSAQYYDTVVLAGNSTSNYDLSSSFAHDNIIITVLSALFVMIILLFTFQSAGIPVLLVLTIQGSIWINFSIPAVSGTQIYFLSYLIITAIMMGATIDYAIVITSRYMELKQQMPLREAMTQSLNAAFPTVITSGTILASAGIIISRLSSNTPIAYVGKFLGQGTIISMILVMCVLPQTLLFGEFIIKHTAFTLKKNASDTRRLGTMRIDGHVRGFVAGFIDADVHGTIRGEVRSAPEQWLISDGGGGDGDTPDSGGGAADVKEGEPK